MGRILVIPLALFVLLAGAIVWSGGGSHPRSEFVFINRGDVYTLDLNQMSYMQDFRMTYGFREGLYGVEPGTLRPIPAGATGYDLSEDKHVWTFHLRPGCKWTNGDPVTAHDYVFSWRRMLEEPGEYTYLFYYIKNAKSYSDTITEYYTYPFRIREYEKDPLKYVRELDAYKAELEKFQQSNPTAGESDPKRIEFDQRLVKELKPQPVAKPAFDEVGIEAPDDLTFRVTLTDPVPYLLELVAFPPFYPRNERSMALFKVALDQDLPKEEKTGQITYRSEYTRPPWVVTNGPFELTKWEFKQRLVLEKSRTYWDRDNVHCQQIEMVVNDNPLSEFLQYEAGKVDWMADVPADLGPELLAKHRPDLHLSPAFGTGFLTFMIRPKLPDSILNGADNPLADVRVRQALAMSIDKQFIVNTVTRLGELPARTYLPPDGTLPQFRYQPGPYDPTKTVYDDKQMRAMLSKASGTTDDVGPGLPTNTERARKLLAEAGYPNGSGFPRLPLLYNTDSTVRAKMVQALKNQWKQALNIDVDIQGIEGKVYKQRISKKEYAIGPAAWYGDYPDVSTFTDKYLTGSLQNDSDYRNPEYDKLCDEATREPDAQKRIELLSRAEAMLDSDVPIVPLYCYVNNSLFRSNVHGVEPNPRGVTIFKGLTVDPH